MSTVRDIAKQTGVSIATVSRVLNNHPSVSDELRSRVMEAANSRRYVSSVGKRDTSNIAYVYTGDASLGSPFDSAVLEGLYEAMADSNLNLMILDVRRTRRNGEDYSQMFQRLGVRGAVLRTTHGTRSTCEKIISQNFPAVVVGDLVKGAESSCVCCESRTASREAIEHLVSLGHRRIAISINVVEDSDHQERMDGYRDAHREHGIETQLPFLNRLHPKASVVPLVIGRVGADRVPRIIDLLSGISDPAPLFVLSSDLSHFLTLDRAEAHDAETARLIETGQPAGLTPAHACGVQAVAGFLNSTFGRCMRVQRLAMANSAEVSGDTARTVGYGAWAIFDTTDEIILPRHREELLKTARTALKSRLKTGKMPQVNETSFATALRGYGASFVTLQQNGRLRGCIGSQKAHMPLVCDVVRNAVKAGTEDPRFKPVTPGEFERIRLKIAVLSPAAPMRFEDESDLLNQLVPGRDGLILSDGDRRGVFLPIVWDSLPDPAAFLGGLKVKAGLPQDHWSASVRVERFCAELMSETG